MSLWKIAWRSIEQRALASTLTALSMALGVALVVAVLVAQGVIHDAFRRGASGYHLVVGKKGSQLQLVLNTVYHLQEVIENVPYTYYKEFLADDNHTGAFAPYVEVAIPYCLGDNYEGFRVVGTIPEMFEKLDYGAGKKYEFESGGRNFEKEHFFEAVVGSAVARKTGLKVGDEFQPTHGLSNEGDGHKHDAFKVVGVLKPTGTANDRALFINMEGFYLLDKHAKPLDEDALAANRGATVDAHADAHADTHADEHAGDTHAAVHPAAEQPGAHEEHHDEHVAHAHDEHAEHDHDEKAHAEHAHDEHAEHDHDEKAHAEHAAKAAEHAEHAHDEHTEHDHEEHTAAESKSAEHAEHAHDEHTVHDHEEHAASESKSAAHDEHADHDHAAHEHAEHDHAAAEPHAADAHTDHDHADHDHAADAHTDHDHADHDHAGHDHDHAHGAHHHHEPLPESQREVTAILVLAKNDISANLLQSKINKGVVAQAASPIKVINDFFKSMVEYITIALVSLTVLIIIVAGVGIMVSIYNSMSDRRRDIAVMRALGAGRETVLAVILLESILLSLGGGVLGFLLGHALIGALGPIIEATSGVSIGFFQFVPYELILIPGLIALASFVGYLPALSAYRTDVGKALSASP